MSVVVYFYPQPSLIKKLSQPSERTSLSSVMHSNRQTDRQTDRTTIVILAAAHARRGLIIYCSYSE